MDNKKQKTRSFINIRLVIVVISALGLVFSTAGCAEKANYDVPSFMEEYEAPETLEHTSIKFLFPGDKPKNWNNVKEELEKRSAKTVNASLDFKWAEFGQYLDTVNVLDASNEVYDAFVLAKPDANYPDFTTIAREGKLKDITKLFPQYALSLYSKYTSEELKFASVDNRLYAIPSLCPQAFCTYLIADDALLTKYKIDDITDFDKYEAFLKAIKDYEPDLAPGTIANMVDSLKLFGRASGYVIADESRKLVYKWDDPEMKLVLWEKTPEFYNAISYIVNWFEKGYLVFNPDQSKTASFIIEGMLSPPSNETTRMTFLDASGEIKQSNPMRAFHLYPEKHVQRDSPMGTFFNNGSFVFPEASTNTERAMIFLDWVQQSRENYLLMTCGIDGEDYVLAEGFPTLPAGMEFADRTYLYWSGSWAFKNIDYEYGEAKGAGSEIVESYKEFLDKNSKYPPHSSFYPNYGVFQQTADDRQVTFMEFEYKLAQGQILDMAEVDAFIKRLEDLGSDKLIEEAQKQMMAK